MSTTLEILTGGHYEVRCYDDPDELGPVLARRRIVSDPELARSMIIAWDCAPGPLWDIIFGDRGTYDEWLAKQASEVAIA